MGLIVNFSDFENISASNLSFNDYLIGYATNPDREVRTTIEDLINFMESASANDLYQLLASSSANWNSTYTSVAANSSKWDSTYTSVAANSSKWDSTYTSLNANSGKYESTYTSLNANSGKYESTYTSLNANSGKWESTYTSLNANSGKYESTYTSLNANSGKYESTYTSLNANSGKYESTYTSLNANSGKYESTYTSLNANSGKYESTYTSLNANSGKYESTYTSLNANSSTWDSTYTSLNANSGKYESTYNNVSMLSGNGTFNLYGRGINLASTVAWTSAAIIPANINDLTGGSPCLVTDVACIIKSRTLNSNVATTGVLFSTPPSFGLDDASGNSHSSSLSIGIKPLSGNYSRTSNGVGVSNSTGKYTYNGGTANIVSVTLPVYLTANLSLSVNNITTSLPLTSANTNFSGSDFHVKVDNEIMYVSSGGSSATMIVARGQLGTTAATHLSGALVTTNVGLSGVLLADVCFTMKRFESF